MKFVAAGDYANGAMDCFLRYVVDFFGNANSNVSEEHRNRTLYYRPGGILEKRPVVFVSLGRTASHDSSHIHNGHILNSGMRLQKYIFVSFFNNDPSRMFSMLITMYAKGDLKMQISNGTYVQIASRTASDAEGELSSLLITLLFSDASITSAQLDLNGGCAAEGKDAQPLAATPRTPSTSAGPSSPRKTSGKYVPSPTPITPTRTNVRGIRASAKAMIANEEKEKEKKGKPSVSYAYSHTCELLHAIICSLLMHPPSPCTGRSREAILHD